MDGYVAEVKELACEILELMAQGLRVPHISVFSKLLRDLNSDSLVRLNHYPPLITNNIHQLLIHDVHEDQNTDVSLISNDRARIFSKEVQNITTRKIGFGEHTDPQILTILRSNDVGGLQISPQDGLWIPVSPHPNTSFSVFVGDTLQVSIPSLCDSHQIDFFSFKCQSFLSKGHANLLCIIYILSYVSKGTCQAREILFSNQ